MQSLQGTTFETYGRGDTELLTKEEKSRIYDGPLFNPLHEMPSTFLGEVLIKASKIVCTRLDDGSLLVKSLNGDKLTISPSFDKLLSVKICNECGCASSEITCSFCLKVQDYIKNDNDDKTEIKNS